MYPGPLPLGSGVRVVVALAGGWWVVATGGNLTGCLVDTSLSPRSREGRRDILSLGTSVAQAKPPPPARNAPSLLGPCPNGAGSSKARMGEIQSSICLAGCQPGKPPRGVSNQQRRQPAPEAQTRQKLATGVLPARASSPPSKPTKSVPCPSRARCSSPVPNPPALGAEHNAARGWSVQPMAQCGRSSAAATCIVAEPHWLVGTYWTLSHRSRSRGLAKCGLNAGLGCGPTDRLWGPSRLALLVGRAQQGTGQQKASPHAVTVNKSQSRETGAKTDACCSWDGCVWGSGGQKAKGDGARGR